MNRGMVHVGILVPFQIYRSNHEIVVDSSKDPLELITETVDIQSFWVMSERTEPFRITCPRRNSDSSSSQSHQL